MKLLCVKVIRDGKLSQFDSFKFRRASLAWKIRIDTAKAVFKKSNKGKISKCYKKVNNKLNYRK